MLLRRVVPMLAVVVVLAAALLSVRTPQADRPRVAVHRVTQGPGLVEGVVGVQAAAEQVADFERAVAVREFEQAVAEAEFAALVEARKPVVRIGTAAVYPAPQWPTSLQPCGGDLPPCYVKWRESHGDYSARNPSSEAACGAWQIITSTWAGFAGYATACDAPPAVQDEKARQLWAGGRGCSHWSACA